MNWGGGAEEVGSCARDVNVSESGGEKSVR